MFAKAFSLGHAHIWLAVELVNTHFAHDDEITSMLALCKV